MQKSKQHVSHENCLKRTHKRMPASLWKGYSCWVLLERLNSCRMPLVLLLIKLETIKQLKGMFFTRVNMKDKEQRVISFWPGRAHKRRKFQWNSFTLTISIVCMCAKQYVFINNRNLFLLEYYMMSHKLKWPNGQTVIQMSEAGQNRWK